MRTRIPQLMYARPWRWRYASQDTDNTADGGMDLGLKCKVAIVTGGTQGIGRATAVLLAKEGAVLYAWHPSLDSQSGGLETR